MFTGLAHAMAPQGGGGGAQGFGAFVPLILIFVIFYFLLLRPQQKKAKEQRNFLDSLKTGDAVVTSGGIHGKIASVEDAIVTLEIADKVRVRVSKSHIASAPERKKKQ
jgi:preprotein translocase subunit YajC